MSYSSRNLTLHTYPAGRRILFLFVFSALFAQLASAYTIIFATGPVTLGSTDKDNAEADITANWGGSGSSITISLINLQLNPKGIASAISGVEIDFANLSAAANASLASTTASTFSIGSGGAISGATNVTSTGWSVETNISNPTAGYSTNTIALCAVCKNTTDASPPNQLVVGGPGGTSSSYSYANGNPSLVGQHSPYILGSGSSFTYGAGTALAGMNTTPTWVINVPQFQATTTITAVRFYFGSAYVVPNQEADATIVETPEPGPISMVVGGLLMIVVTRLSRTRAVCRS